MKKVLSAILAAGMVFGLAACSGSQTAETEKQEETVRDWERQGYFTDENANLLTVLPSMYDEYPGWYVGLFLNDDAYGWVVQQEGNSLHGNIVPEYDEGEFVVTVTEEGEDGLLLTLENGETYHFTKTEMPEATIIATVNIEGFGAINYVEGTETPEFDPEHPYQSAQINLAEPATYTFLATADMEGWKFVKWTLNGEDYSTDELITVELTENADFIAVFESEN